MRSGAAVVSFPQARRDRDNPPTGEKAETTPVSALPLQRYPCPTRRLGAG